MLPCAGDRILVLKEQWLNLILRRDKTIEIRGCRFKSGRYFLGSKGKIYADCYIGEGIPIENMDQWQTLFHQHRVPTDFPPYKKTWVLPISDVAVMNKPICYVHPRGAIGVVKYKVASYN